MKRRKEYQIGEKIGNCIFIEELPTKKVGNTTIRRFMRFKCVCGKDFETFYLNVKNGNTKSCGCIGKEKIKNQGFKNKTHGQRKHPLYSVWKNMIDRCENNKNIYYYNYGGRGIKVCDRWKNILLFIGDMYNTYEKGLDIDRIDVNGDYEKSNCRWVTRKVNCNNMRKNKRFAYKDKNLTVSEWSSFFKIPYQTCLWRINKWGIDKCYSKSYNS
jgi:hypothetical protein